jgi:hypothetical protein
MEIILALAIGFGGGWFMHKPSQLDCRNDALITVSCPELTPITDSTFGGHIIKLQAVGSTYMECRSACIKAD